MAKNILTIYISDTVIRLMQTDGKHITDWAEVKFDPDLIEGNVVNESDRVADNIRQIMDIKSLKTRKVLVGIGGIRCLTRPIMLPKLPGEIIDEAVRREAERLLPVPLDELYMSWQTIPAPEGKTQVFLTAIPRRIVSPLIETLDKAGLKPTFMDLKPLLLARVAREENSILVDVQENDFDIVIMVKGVPQPIRTVPFPGDNPTPEEKLMIIREELNRTITFYNSNNPDSMVEDDVRVHVSGIISDELEFCSRLSQEVQREVEVLPPPVETPQGFNASLYMANIGLFLQETASGKNIGPSVVNLNILPEEFLPQPVSSLNILKMLGIAFAVIFLAGMFVYMQNQTSQVDARKDILATSQSVLRQKQTEVGILNREINELNILITQEQQTNQNLTDAISLLETSTSGMNGDLDVAFKRVPKTVRLVSVIHDNTEVNISGIARSESSILSYFSSLESSRRFTGLEINHMIRREDEDIDVTLRGSSLVNSNWISAVEVILGKLPKQVALNFAETSLDSMTLNGNSTTEEALLTYLDDLDKSGEFVSIDIINIIEIEDGGYDFYLQLVVGVQTDDNA